MSEIINIDNKYQIEIINRGESVNLLRYNEKWVENPPQSKVLIAIAYEIEKLRNDLAECDLCCVTSKIQRGLKENV